VNVGALTAPGLAQAGLSLSRIADGTSNVLMLATRYAECGNGTTTSRNTYYSGTPKNGNLANSLGTPAPTNGSISAGIAAGGFFGAGKHNMAADRQLATDRTFQVAPKWDTQCSTQDSVYGQSFSAGGMSVSLADASVRS